MCYGKLNKHKHSNKGGFIIKHYIKNNLPLLHLCKSLHKCKLHMRWDNGRTLAVVPGEDSFRKLTEEELAEEQKQETEQENNENMDEDDSAPVMSM